MAFTVEALVNFVGYKKVENWQERQRYENKINQVCTVVGINFDKNLEPFSTLWQLKQSRDFVAHGKPIEINQHVNSSDELKEAMVCPWDKYLNPKYINHAYESVKHFERLLFTKGSISILDSVTSASNFVHET